MRVKYNKSRDSFEVRHYEDLTDVEIIKGMKTIENVPDEIVLLIKKKKELEFEQRKITAEIEDLENYQDVIGRVTHTYNGVPIMQIYNPPSEDNPAYGGFDFSEVSGKHRKSLHAWTNAHLSDEERLTTRDIWYFCLKDESGSENTFLPHQYKSYKSDRGFDIDFLKLIAYEFIVNKKPLVEFKGNMDQWFEIFNRDKAIQDLLES